MYAGCKKYAGCIKKYAGCIMLYAGCTLVVLKSYESQDAATFARLPRFVDVSRAVGPAQPRSAESRILPQSEHDDLPGLHGRLPPLHDQRR